MKFYFIIIPCTTLPRKVSTTIYSSVKRLDMYVYTYIHVDLHYVVATIDGKLVPVR
jgi:hypothetical protein